MNPSIAVAHDGERVEEAVSAPKKTATYAGLMEENKTKGQTYN